MSATVLLGDALSVLKTMPSDSVDCCVTSPPYWGLRDYGVEGQMGLEPTIHEFIARMVPLFEEVRRVLKPAGTCWINMGDCYATGAGKVNTSPVGGTQGERWKGIRGEDKIASMGPLQQPNRMPQPGLKPKDLVGQPWRLAFALQDAGWWLRQDIIWHKLNPMPESIGDRFTKAHEYIFLLAKSERYYWDKKAIQEPASPGTHARLSQKNLANQVGSSRANGGTRPNRKMKAVGIPREQKTAPDGSGVKNNASFNEAMAVMPLLRNPRSVWSMATEPYKEAHFATFPTELPRRAILAGCPVGGLVLDPFNGSGTTGQVALELGRRYVGIELNPEYVELTKRRFANVTLGLPLEAA